MDPIASELADVYQRLARAIAERDADAVRAELVPTPVTADSFVGLAPMFPILDPLEVAHAERVGKWACLWLRTTRAVSDTERFLLVSLRLVNGRWRVENYSGQRSYRRTGDAEKDATRFAVLIEEDIFDRPKPRARRSATYVPPAQRTKRARPVCPKGALADVLRLSDAFEPLPETAVDELERRLGCLMPACYREIVCTFGAALLSGWVRVYPPERVTEQLDVWRARVEGYNPWTAGADLLDDESLAECVVVADTVGGDEVVFHPADPAVLYALPRHGAEVFEVGDSLHAAIEWLTGSGKLTAAIALKYVEPLTERAWLRAVPDETTDVSFADLVTELVDLGIHDARADGEDEDGAWAQLVSCTLGGILTVLDTEPPGPPDVQVTFDPRRRGIALARVESVLARHGFTVDRHDPHT